MDYGLFGVRFLFLDMKKERCSIDDYSSILQRSLFILRLIFQDILICPNTPNGSQYP